MTLADEIIAAARAALGTPFLHQGRVPGRALDCAGLCVHVMQTIGAPYVDEIGYSRRPHHGRLQAVLDAQVSLVRVATPAPGDLLLLRFGREPTHLGIYTGETIIHAYETVGRVVEHRWPDGVSTLVQAYCIVRPDHE